MNIVIVESPAKAKTINKYLGPDYTVIASYGHIRDLPAKNGSVLPDSDFAMKWEIDPKALKHVKSMADAVKGAENLYLATDPDREGEAISWHVREVLEERKVLEGVQVKRVVFNEITKKAVREAFANPRELDTELIEAYLARRALDYLVGFTLSPVLWRKLPGSKSAGRVQSVALRMICERETEIEVFKPREYWTVKALFRTGSGEQVPAQLTHVAGSKLDKMGLADEAAADAAIEAAQARDFTVAKVDRKKLRRHPAPPFTTSTLQQEAARKLGFTTKRTMQVAQKLYEGVNTGAGTVGLITYMRTDGVQIAGEAIAACRALIAERHGAAYLPSSPRAYKSKAKNAQEAHEAIRPTGFNRSPEDVSAYLDRDQKRLYELIWKRMVASQMESAVLDQVAVSITTGDGAVAFRATGSVVAFDGFQKLYREGRDEANANGEEDRILPDIKEGEALHREKVDGEQHFTQPPPRFTEASLVKRLEELGIGRPSTYASIIEVLQKQYVRLEKRRFTPEDRGRLVTAFLTSFFHRYVEYSFTADLEEKLDDISGGRIDWKSVLREFWTAFIAAVDETKDLRVRDVLDALNDLLGPHFFGGGGAEARACPQCDDGQISLKLGKFGAFIGCSNYPECRYTRPLEVAAEGDGAGAANGPRVLGTDPKSGLEVTLRKGPYGFYVQLGEAVEKTKPKRASLTKAMSPDSVDLQIALNLLALPRDIGPNPETGDMITAGIGRYGPYIRHGDVYVSLKGDDDVLEIGLNRAVVVLAEAPKKAQPKKLGGHPDDGKPVTLRSGRYGAYVQHGSLRANLLKGNSADDLTLEAAVEILAVKAAKGGKGKKKPRAGKTKRRRQTTPS
jgi:DNA topoisomerase-1